MPVVKLTPTTTTTIDDDEQVLLEMDNVGFFPSAEQSDGIGRLLVTSKSVSWHNAQSGGVRIDFRSIVMHAVAASDTAAQQALGAKCLYCQIDNGAADDADDAPVEFRFVPVEAQLSASNADPTATIYEAMCKGAELNPDLGDGTDEGDAIAGGLGGFDGDWSSKFIEPEDGAFGDNEDNNDDDNNDNDNNNNDDDNERFADAVEPDDKRAKTSE